MTREVYRDAAGRTVEHVQYRCPDRDVLVCRDAPAPGRPFHTARTLGPGYVPGSGEVDATAPQATVAAALTALGIDVATLVPA